MNVRKAFISFVCCLCFSVAAFAQRKNDEALARQYFEKAEYDKASAIYEKLYDDNPTTYYKAYFKTLLAQKAYDKAEKVVKKFIKHNQLDLSPYVDWGYLYILQDQPAQAKKCFEKGIEQLHPSQEQALLLSTAFADRGELEYAVEALLHARKLMAGAYTFNFELADLYSRKQDTPHMIEEYLSVLEQNQNFLQNVQNLLQNYLADDEKGAKKEFIRTALLKRIQQNPDNQVFSDLLIWVYVQLRDFDAAFVQTKAIEVRNKEDGTRMLQLASFCMSNAKYDAAVKCYQYIITKGKLGPYYVSAKIGELDASYKSITESYTYTAKDLSALETDFNTTLQELGKSANTAPLMRNLAHLQAFYLHKNTEAIVLLTFVTEMPGIEPHYKAECKLDLGDILLLNGQIWDASLLYSQVDLDFKHDAIGEEAKFRNARLSYYSGEFLWAQGQLDVLKGGTSHLIANDAMALSLLIQENAPDSDFTGLAMYSRADMLVYQNRDEEAITVLDSIMTRFPQHPLADEILVKKGEIAQKKGQFTAAIDLLQQVVSNFSDGILADKALFQIALLYDTKLNDKIKAMTMYEKLLENYPGSLLVDDARKNYRLLRGDNINPKS